MIKPLPISWFYENLPEEQLIEENFKEIIKKNYSLSWFTPLDTPAIERVEVLTSKWADDNEIYAIKRLKAEWKESENFEFWLRFDLTVPLARYVAQYEWELTFPFKRQQIARVYRWERAQKWRYREFYQADVDIIWNGKLDLFADVEIVSTIFNSLKDLDFWDFVININNKKFLAWFLESIWIIGEDIIKTIWVIDKKDKVNSEKLKQMYLDLGLTLDQIDSINSFISFWEENDSLSILEKFKNLENKLLKDGIEELSFVYNSLMKLWVDSSFIKINPAISRGLNYYTWTVFETFISEAESMWSISSGGRYENLSSNFTKNNFPWVGWSIWLSRLIAVLNEVWKIKLWSKTTTKVLVANMWEEFLTNNLQIVKSLRKNNISSEFYIDWKAKLQKQFKYANNKKIPYVIIIWEDELKNNTFQFKNLEKGEQFEITIKDIKNYIK